MASLASIPGIKVIMFILICLSQIVGGTILPRTNGFAHVGWTLACLGIYIFSFWLMALMIRFGIPLSSLIPLMSAIIPLSLIAIGVWGFGEPASLVRITLLVGACLLIGTATVVG